MQTPTDIFDAIYNNDLDYIEKHPNQIHYYGNNDMQHPFTFAVADDKLDCIEKMIKMKTVNPNKRYDGKTPVQTAIENENPQMLEMLLRNGGNPNLKIKHVFMPVKIVAVEYVIDKLNILQSSSISNIAQFATSKKHLTEMIHLLFHYGADPALILFHYVNYGADPTDKKDYLKKFVEKEFFHVVKKAWLPVGISLSHLSAVEQMTILEQMFPAIDFIPFHKRWNLITAIKHFKN